MLAYKPGMPRVGWVLNLDADHELARPLGYIPTDAVQRRVRQMTDRLAGLVLDEHVVIGHGAAEIGICWCPTPTALKRLERAGVAGAATPPFDVIRRVNHRRFCAELGQTLVGAELAEDRSIVDRILSSSKGRWVLKRPHSVSGSGRRRLLAGEALTPADDQWIAASLRKGPLQVEPWVVVVDELVVHGFIHRDGGHTLGTVCFQETDDYGHWLRTFPATKDITPIEREALTGESRRVAEALSTVGYWGPFGVDAFRYRRSAADGVDGDDEGDVVMNIRSEVNARYTMGWAVGMGDLRADLAAENLIPS